MCGNRGFHRFNILARVGVWNVLNYPAAGKSSIRESPTSPARGKVVEQGIRRMMPSSPTRKWQAGFSLVDPNELLVRALTPPPGRLRNRRNFGAHVEARRRLDTAAQGRPSRCVGTGGELTPDYYPDATEGAAPG